MTADHLAAAKDLFFDYLWAQAPGPHDGFVDACRYNVNENLAFLLLRYVNVLTATPSRHKTKMLDAILGQLQVYRELDAHLEEWYNPVAHNMMWHEHMMVSDRELMHQYSRQ